MSETPKAVLRSIEKWAASIVVKKTDMSALTALMIRETGVRHPNLERMWNEGLK